MHIIEWQKLYYTHDKVKPPIDDKDGYEKWYVINEKVKKKPINVNESRNHEVLLMITSSMWNLDALLKAFYNGNDVLQVFVLNQKVFVAKQNGKSLSKCYEKLTEVFHKLYHHDKVVMKGLDDMVAYRIFIE